MDIIKAGEIKELADKQIDLSASIDTINKDKPRTEVDKARVCRIYKTKSRNGKAMIIGADIQITDASGREYIFSKVSRGCVYYMASVKYLDNVRLIKHTRGFETTDGTKNIVIGNFSVEEFNENILEYYNFNTTDSKFKATGCGTDDRPIGAIFDNRDNVIGLILNIGKRSVNLTLEDDKKLIKQYKLTHNLACSHEEVKRFASAHTTKLYGSDFISQVNTISVSFDVEAARAVFGNSIRVLKSNMLKLDNEVSDNIKTEIVRHLNSLEGKPKESVIIGDIGKPNYYIPIVIDKEANGNTRDSKYVIVHTNRGFWIIPKMDMDKHIDVLNKSFTMRYIPWFVEKTNAGNRFSKKYNGTSKYWV